MGGLFLILGSICYTLCMKWETPPDIKIYEALGAVADGRVETEGNTAKVYSSSGNKFYEVEYDPETSSIMTNDNGSYWKGYLGYPAIAYLMQIDVLSYDKDVAESMKGIAWKDINTKFKNDFDKTIEFIFKDLSAERQGILKSYVLEIKEEIDALDLNLLGIKRLPPAGY